jgi:hypothetical protein
MIFEIDAKIIVKAVQSRAFPRTKWGQITKNVARVFKDNDDFTISWVKRDNNHVAHTLAKWAILEPNKQWVNSMPICISNHVQKDMGHVT